MEAYAAILAFSITTVFILTPNPYWMALFAFVAQPLFALAAVKYLFKVFMELRKKDVL